MAEAEQPGKIFIGGLNIETKQKTLQIVFGRFGPMAQGTSYINTVKSLQSIYKVFFVNYRNYDIFIIVTA